MRKPAVLGAIVLPFLVAVLPVFYALLGGAAAGEREPAIAYVPGIASEAEATNGILARNADKPAAHDGLDLGCANGAES